MVINIHWAFILAVVLLALVAMVMVGPALVVLPHEAAAPRRTYFDHPTKAVTHFHTKQGKT